MIFSKLSPFLFLPLVAAEGVYKLKLQKFPRSVNDINGHLESAYLAEKYGGQLPQSIGQTPLVGSGGYGRRMRIGRPGKEDDGLFWTQEVVNGGHSIPLTSMYLSNLQVQSLTHSYR